MANEKQSGSDDQSKQRGGAGNFAKDPERASEAGKKGGQSSHGGSSGQSHQSGSGRSQQSGVTSDDADDNSSDSKSQGGNRSGNQR